MLRWAPLLSLTLVLLPAGAQEPAPPSGAALSFARSYHLPRSSAQVYDEALAAWQMTFAREPGAKLERTDKEAGVLEGTARMNYRSAMLTAREETMGVITYRVLIQAGNGECRVLITTLKHSGNRITPGGGKDFGLLAEGVRPVKPVPGLGARNQERIYADMKTQASSHLDNLLRAFGSLVRRSAEP
ncbi:MAG: DUF4468 domain-containing protein [Flavobacteriales bacterium]|nr:DUF4468 domain-containing protein [Flavobacteriales bacterium]